MNNINLKKTFVRAVHIYAEYCLLINKLIWPTKKQCKLSTMLLYINSPKLDLFLPQDK